MLVIENFSVGYQRKMIVSNVNFSLNEGEITALIGPNGTGKSTLLKGISGLLPCTGQVNFDPAENISSDGKFAYMPQDTLTHSSLTVLEVILLGQLRSLGLRVPSTLIDSAYQALGSFELLHLQARCLGELSGGQRQIVYLAQALFRNTSVLLLDEPTGALDLKYQLSVLEAVKHHTRRAKIITVMAMHDLTLASRYADRIICLSGGKIVADGPPKRVLSRDLIQSVYGVDAEILITQDGHQCVVPLYI
jgi:iron complex transport system ATP-binding protein